MDMNTLKQLWFESRKGNSQVIVGIIGLVVIVLGAVIIQSIGFPSATNASLLPLNGTASTILKFIPTVMILAGMGLAGMLGYKQFRK